MKLHTLKPASGSIFERKRIGRGPGSGKGRTATRGTKGQQSRSGYSRKKGFEGGQMPLQRRLPKFGFKNPFRVEYEVINLDTLQELLDRKPTAVVDHQYLKSNGIISTTKALVKLLGRGEIKIPVTVHLNKFSETAIEAIKQAGGTVHPIES